VNIERINTYFLRRKTVKNALIVDDTFGDFEAGFAIAAIIGHTY